ncbi:MAG: radical SAM protein [Deltaproteobacteria bacterium]|nr:radical SAM protein [Deltaproteobacteria bacterium]
MDARRGFEERLSAHLRLVEQLDAAALYRGVEQYFFVSPLQPPTLPGIRALTLGQICASWRSLARDIEDGKAPEMVNLYLHVPFCQHRCTYCIFHSTVATPERVESYLAMLKSEMTHLARAVEGLEFATCYIGGGTPTVLSDRQTCELLDHLDSCFQRRRGGQWAFECNPLSVTETKARIFSDHGFNHVNIGVQTLEPEVLARVNRAYETEAMVLESLRILMNQRFFTNVDLLHGLPGDTLESELRTFERILRQRPQRVTIYNLSPSTPLEDLGPRDLAPLAERILSLSEQAGYYASIDSTCIGVNRYDHNSRMRDEVELAGERIDYSDTADRPSSLLGLGSSARTFIYGRISYQRDEHEPGRLHSDAPIARGRILGRSEEQRRFVTKRLADKGLRLKDYESRFAEILEDRFQTECEALHSLGLIEERDGVLVHTGDDPATRFAAELFFVEGDWIQAAELHLLQERGASVEADADSEQPLLTLEADGIRLRIALTALVPGEDCYHCCGRFAFFIPRSPDPTQRAETLGPFEEGMLRAFARFFDRLVTSEKPESVQELLDVLRQQELELAIRSPAGTQRKAVIRLEDPAG